MNARLTTPSNRMTTENTSSGNLHYEMTGSPKEAGFKTTVKQVKDTKHRAKWKREFGTLFIIGEKVC